jgi:hypothetical protein
VNGGVAAGGPASAPNKKLGMRHFADPKSAWNRGGVLNLQMAFQAKIVIAFDKKLPID